MENNKWIGCDRKLKKLKGIESFSETKMENSSKSFGSDSGDKLTFVAIRGAPKSEPF